MRWEESCGGRFGSWWSLSGNPGGPTTRGRLIGLARFQGAGGFWGMLMFGSGGVASINQRVLGGCLNLFEGLGGIAETG